MNTKYPSAENGTPPYPTPGQRGSHRSSRARHAPHNQRILLRRIVSPRGYSSHPCTLNPHSATPHSPSFPTSASSHRSNALSASGSSGPAQTSGARSNELRTSAIVCSWPRAETLITRSARSNRLRERHVQRPRNIVCPSSDRQRRKVAASAHMLRNPESADRSPTVINATEAARSGVKSFGSPPNEQ